MKKTIKALALCAALLLAGCGTAAPSISVFNWGDYIDERVLAMFTDETGIRVVYDTYATNEDMYTKIKNGGSAYDVLFPSDYMIERMIKEDMLAPLNPDNIPNRQYIDARFGGLSYDPEDTYSVPYMWGTLGILYNTDMVDDPVDSWDILWDEKYANNIFMYASLRDSLAVALKRAGCSLNTTDPDELNAAKQSLIAQKPLVRAYLDDAVKHSMIGGEGALAVVYSGDAIFCMEENASLDYAVPQEGSNVFYDAVVVPKGAANQAAAEAFINFLCKPEIALLNTEYIGYATTNAGAFALLDAETQNDPRYWPPDEVFYKCEAFTDLGGFLGEYDKAWTEVLASR